MWTMDNTEGFTEAELALINEARVALLLGCHEDDVNFAGSVDNALGNAWRSGISLSGLIAAARVHLAGTQ